MYSRVELLVIGLVLLSQSIWSAPSNPSQVSTSSQHGNLHGNEETADGMLPSARDSEETTRNSAGNVEEDSENGKAHPVAGGSVVSRTDPGGWLLSSDSSSTSTPRVTTERFSIWSRKLLSGTTPTDSKSHIGDNIKDEDDVGGGEFRRNNEFHSADEDSANKSDGKSSSYTPNYSSRIIKDKIEAADGNGQNTEEDTSSSSMKNSQTPAHLHRIPLNRSNVLPAQSLLPPTSVEFNPPSQSQEYHSDEKGLDSTVSKSGESNENVGDVDPSNSTDTSDTICIGFSCLSNSSTSSEENPPKQEIVDVVLIPGDGFRPPAILIIDTIITDGNSTENSGETTEDTGNDYSEENGSSTTSDDNNASVTITPSPPEESLKDVSSGIVGKLNSPHDALNGTILHDSRLNDKKGSRERNEMSGLHLRPWFINHEPTDSNGSSGTSTTSTNSTNTTQLFHSNPNTTLNSTSSNTDDQTEDKNRAEVNSFQEKMPPILPAGHSPPESDEKSGDASTTDIYIGERNTDISQSNEEKSTEPQTSTSTSSPIVSRFSEPLNRRRRDSIFSHLPNNSKSNRSQSVTHSGEYNSSSSSQESNISNMGNSTPSPSIESDEMDSNGNATTGKDTIHIFLEVLHLQPISDDDDDGNSTEKSGKEGGNSSSTQTSPIHSSQDSQDTEADNSASDGSLDSTSNQNSTGSNSHRVARRESHSADPALSASSHGGSSGGAGGGTAGKSNPSPSPPTSTTAKATTPNAASLTKQSPPATGKPTSTASSPKPITSNKDSFDLPPLLNVRQH